MTPASPFSPKNIPRYWEKSAHQLSRNERLLADLKQVEVSRSALWSERPFNVSQNEVVFEEDLSSWSYAPLFREDGSVGGVIASGVSTIAHLHRRRIDASKLEKLIHNAPVAVWAIDANGIFIASEGKAVETSRFQTR